MATTPITRFDGEHGSRELGTDNDNVDYRKDQTKVVTTTIRGITPQNETSKEPKSWQFYPLVASASILLAYLTFIVLRYSYSRSKLLQGWTRRLVGKPPMEEKMLLHTLPYYLAITRSSCEVVCLFCLIISFSEREQKTQFVAYFNNPNHQDYTIKLA